MTKDITKEVSLLSLKLNRRLLSIPASLDEKRSQMLDGDQLSNQNNEVFERADDGGERDFVDNENAVLDEANEPGFNAVKFDVDSIIESIPSISPTLLKESRMSPYPASCVTRFPVPDCFVCWTVRQISIYC